MKRSIAAVGVGWFGISLVADGLPTLVVPFQIASSGGGPADVGLLTFLALSVAAGIQPIAGALSDRVGRLPVMVAGVATAAIGLGLLTLPSGLGPGAVIALVGVSVSQAGYQPLMPDRVPRAARGQAAGAKGLFDVGGAAFGFAVLGGLLASGSIGPSLVVLIAGLAGSLLLAILLLPRAAAPRNPVDETSHSHTFGWLIASRFLFLVGIYAVGRFLLLFIADRLEQGPNAPVLEAGFVLAVLALITAASALPAGWLVDRFGRRSVMLAGGLMGALGVAGFPLAASGPEILAFGVLMAVGTAAFGAANWAGLADTADGPRSGRLLGIANFGTAGAAAAAGLFGPIIDAVDRVAPTWGYTAAFGIAGFLSLLGAVAGWRALRVDRLSMHPALQVSGS